VDLLGERLSCCVLQRPGGGSGGVVVQRERGVQVRRTDVPLAVGEGVDEREADCVRFGASGDLADDPVVGLCELSVGVMPELAGVRVEADLAGGLGVFESRGEQPRQAGAVERVVVAAFGQQALSSAGDEEDAVEIAVGELDRGGVAA
jgi:hypothetical protein